MRVGTPLQKLLYFCTVQETGFCECSVPFSEKTGFLPRVGLVMLAGLSDLFITSGSWPAAKGQSHEIEMYYVWEAVATQCPEMSCSFLYFFTALPKKIVGIVYGFLMRIYIKLYPFFCKNSFRYVLFVFLPLRLVGTFKNIVLQDFIWLKVECLDTPWLGPEQGKVILKSYFLKEQSVNVFQNKPSLKNIPWRL